MKSQLTIGVLAATLPSLLCLTGCQTPYSKGDAAAQSYRQASWEVQAETRDLKTTMATLNNLVDKPAADLKPQFEAFDAALYRLEADESRNAQAAGRIQARNTQYLQEWDRELSDMSFDAVRNRCAARKTEVTQHFDAVDKRYGEARATIEPLIDYLNDVRRALTADLTQPGLENIKPIVANANTNSHKVEEALQRLSTELAQTSASMSSVAYQTPQLGTTQTAAR
ncbi:MAG TPA: DUF2959 family protein [Verrucomicrobiae bacterium]|nr:DUF2959 family protein [Verrucomicrobiae bacterium]